MKKELQEIYKEWRKSVEIEGMPFKWLGNEKILRFLVNLRIQMRLQILRL